jgi:hypothetical protein
LLLGIRGGLQYRSPYIGSNKTAEDAKFDAIISELQEIVIDPQFEKNLGAFMKKYWGGFDGNASQQQEKEVFLAYKAEI